MIALDRDAAGDLDITDTVRITGIGLNATMPDDVDRLPIVVGALGFDTRLFRITPEAGTVLIEGLQLQGGDATMGPITGGAISNSAHLTVRHVRFESNAAQRGGAIDSLVGSTLLVEDSDFAFNSANAGSAIASLGDTTIRRSSSARAVGMRGS